MRDVYWRSKSCCREGCHSIRNCRRTRQCHLPKRVSARLFSNSRFLVFSCFICRYLLDITDPRRGDESYRLADALQTTSVLTIQFLRLCMHLLLSHSLEVNLKKKGFVGIANLLFPSSKSPSLDRVRAALLERIDMDWISLKTTTSLPDKAS